MPSAPALSRSTMTRRLQGVVLQVGGDVGEDRAVAAIASVELLRPALELGLVEALHDELVLALRRAAADAQVLHRRDEGLDARHLRRGRGADRQGPCRAAARSALRLQLDEQAALVERCRRRRCDADARGDMGDIGRLREARSRDLAAAASIIASNEMSWRASVVTCSWPMSSCGKKPFGMVMNSQTVSATVPRKTSEHQRAGSAGRDRAARR